MRHLTKFFFILICISLASCHQSSKPSNNLSVLCGDSNYKIWNAQVGRGIIFYKEGYLREFDTIDNKRVYATYGDVLMDTVAFELHGDTLKIPDLGQVCMLLKKTNDTLVLRDLTKIWGVDTLRYFRSSKQKDLPVEK
jgi:hypothetical protein